MESVAIAWRESRSDSVASIRWLTARAQQNRETP